MPNKYSIENGLVDSIAIGGVKKWQMGLPVMLFLAFFVFQLSEIKENKETDSPKKDELSVILLP